MKPLLLLLVATICLADCGKRNPAAAPPAPPATSQASEPSPAPEAAPVPPAVAAPGEAAPAAEGKELGLEELNAALNAYIMGQLKAPNTLDDLVKAGLIKRVPPAPAGKKFALAANKMAVVLVDK